MKYCSWLLMFLCAGPVWATEADLAAIDAVAFDFNPLHQVSPAMAQGGHEDAEAELCAQRPGDDPSGTFCQGGGGDPAAVNPESADCRDWGRNDPRGFCFDAYFITRNFDGIDVERSGIKIDMTVYVPSQVRMGRSAPLVIHSHGFGGAKASNFNTPGAFAAEQAARKMWQDHGYFVISFSERGFGKSTDLIAMMRPELEGLDTNEVIDWAVKHFRAGIHEFVFDSANPAHISAAPDASCRPHPGQGDANKSETGLNRGKPANPSVVGKCAASLLHGDNGAPLDEADPDPAIGMLGYSYGGGFQYTATHAAQRLLGKQRIDAISPQGTWFDLRYSLAQNDVPKTAWINILTAFAAEGSTAVGLEDGQFRPVPQLILQARAEADVLNRVRGETSETFLQHSPVNYCDPVNGSSTKGVDVFHVQGLQDTLFNFNDGYNNVICSEKAGNDARLLMVTGGHVLPGLSPANHSGNTGMSIDEVVWCGKDRSNAAALSVSDMTVAWYREKLEGIRGAANMIPKACIVQENLDRNDPRIDPKTGKLGHPAFHAEAGFEPAIPNYNKHRFAGEGVSFKRLADVPVGCVKGGPGCGIKKSTQLVFGPAGSSEFVPLYTVPKGGAKVIAGIPTLNLTMNVPHPDPIVFVGIGVRRGGAAPLNAVTDRSGAVSNSVVGEIISNDVDDCQASGNCFEGFRGQDSEGYRDQFKGNGSGERGTNDVELLHAQLLAIRALQYPYAARSGPLETQMDEQVLGKLTTAEFIENNPRGVLWFGCPPNVSECAVGRMVGISSRLNPGDEVGLYFFGSHVQYATNSARVAGPADVKFTANLPIFDR